MYLEVLHTEKQTDSFPYTYFLEFDWPEHIEMMLRRLIWARLVELTEETDAELTAMSDNLAGQVCWAMITSPDTHSAILDVLAGVESAAFAERIAENPKTSALTLARLAGHASPMVRAAVAENPNTPEEVINILARDEDADVRYSMAENHQLNGVLLEILSDDQNPYVASRARCTLNRIAPPVVAAMPMRRTQRTKDSLRKVAMG
ncbi:MAG TPA: hypothetical protein V6C76_17855 [Drouetiella sp.]